MTLSPAETEQSDGDWRLEERESTKQGEQQDRETEGKLDKQQTDTD